MAEPNGTTDIDDAVDDAAPKSSKLGLLIMLPVLLIGMAGGGWIAYSAYPKVASAAAVFGLEQGPVTQVAEQEKTIEYGTFHEISSLIINPAGTDGMPVLMVSIGLESPNEKLAESIEGRRVVIEDAILRVLSMRTPEELTRMSLRDTLKTDIMSTVNEILQKDEVERVYFTKYIIQ